jgi:hypothetical protein
VVYRLISLPITSLRSFGATSKQIGNSLESNAGSNLCRSLTAKMKRQLLDVFSITFAKKTAESIIKLAVTLVEAEHTLLAKEMFDFCDKVGLQHDSSNYRKLMKIGQEASRFEPFLDRLPSSWTSLYKLAKLEKDQFDHLTQDQRFTRTMTAADIDGIVHGSPNGNGGRVAADMIIDLTGLERPKKIALCKTLKKLGDEHGFHYVFRERLARELMEKPSLAVFLDTVAD